MKLFKQSKKFLTKENIQFIEETVLGQHFPFFFNYTKPLTKEPRYLFLAHTVQNRMEDFSLDKVLNTDEHTYKNTLDILLNFLKSINEKHHFFTRICYNLTFNNGSDRAQIHRDHPYAHKQIIIYLNDSEKKATTCMINKKGKVIKEIVPEKFTGVCFDDVDHYQLFPKKGPRLTLVATYI
jgi:hypothetical protein